MFAYENLLNIGLQIRQKTMVTRESLISICSLRRARTPISAVQVEASERLGLCAPQESLITLRTSLGKIFQATP